MNQLHGIIGESADTKRLREEIRRFAPFRYPVLILGETGTGKELVARAIHCQSGRKRDEPVSINCGAIPENLIESELFGYEAGSHSTATKQFKGKFEQAHEGSLFLDEIGELPINLQPRLLRVIQEKNFYRLGGNTLVNIDVRIIAATHKTLREKVAAKEFRSDLWERLRILVIEVSPLRVRPDDIPIIANHFLSKKMADEMGRPGIKVHLTEGAIKALQLRDWPGNVRELQGVLIRSVLFAISDATDVITLEAQDLKYDGDTSPGSLNSVGSSELAEDVLARIAFECLSRGENPLVGLRQISGSKDEKGSAFTQTILTALEVAIDRFCSTANAAAILEGAILSSRITKDTSRSLPDGSIVRFDDLLEFFYGSRSVPGDTAFFRAQVSRIVRNVTKKV